MKEIIALETQYRDLLIEKLKNDERLDVTCPHFAYPEPVFVYIRSKKTDKTIAVRLDGEDGTMRFWDYVDDDYSDEDGVWEKMTADGLDKFIKKLYNVMERAVDVEFYNADGECDEFCSGVFKAEFNLENATKTVKKLGKGREFAFVGFINYFGDVRYLFDRTFKEVKVKKK